jgi:hypothetical protein
VDRKKDGGMSEIIFDPFKRITRPAPSPDEIERIRIQVFETLAATGSYNAVLMLMPMLATFLWNEELPSSGIEFERFMNVIKHALKREIEALEASAGPQSKGDQHAWH